MISKQTAREIAAAYRTGKRPVLAAEIAALDEYEAATRQPAQRVDNLWDLPIFGRAWREDGKDLRA